MTVNLLDLWQSVHARFDPMSPPQDPQWRVQRTKNQLLTLSVQLNRPFEDELKFLLAGTIGVGKSTELSRLAEQRKGRDFVVLFDVRRHLADVVGEGAALGRLEPWELLVFVGLAVARAAEESFPNRWHQEAGGLLDQLSAAWAAMLGGDAPTIKIGQLIKTVAIAFTPLVDGGASFTTIAGATGALDWNVELGRRNRRTTDRDPKVRRLALVVSEIVRKARTLAGRPLLFLLDGLDGLDRLASKDDRDRARQLLIESELLRKVPCRMVVLAPFALRFDLALAAVPGAIKVVLANEPVLSEDAPGDPDAPGAGVKFFADLFAARVEGLPRSADALLPPALLTRLAWSSGGRARDFVEFIRNAAGYAYTEGLDQITEDIVDKVLDERRRLLETGLYAPHVELLQRVQAAPHQPLPDDERLSALLASGRLLPYPNESAWHFPHPLLLPYLGRERAVARIDPHPRVRVPQQAAWPIRVDRIELTRYRGFESFALDLHEQVTLIIGPNGAGKSTVLEALAVALAAWTEGMGADRVDALFSADRAGRRVSVGDAVEMGWPLVIEAGGTVGDASWRFALEAEGPEGAGFASSLVGAADDARRAVTDPQTAAAVELPLIARIGPRLGGVDAGADDPKWFRSRVATYRAALQGGLSIAALIRWMRWQEESATQALGIALEAPDAAPADQARARPPRVPELDAISAAACAVLPGAQWVRYHLASQQLQVKLDDGQLLEFELLSDGMRRICGLAMRLAWMAARLNPQYGAEAAARVSGVVLIDEVELHLHPTWQREILGRLTATFPKVQFVATTHSPQVAASAQPEWMRVLSAHGVHGVDKVRGRDSNALLREVFDSSDRPRWMVEKLVAIEEAIDEGRVNDAQVLLDEVRVDLGADDPTALGLEWELADVETDGAAD